MKWTKDAKILINKVPALMQDMAIKEIEKTAEKEGLKEVTLPFVTKVSAKFAMMRDGKHGGHGHKKTIESFYANTDKPAIYAGFKRKGGVHAGMSGSMIENDNLSDLWNEVKDTKDKSEKRALYIHIPFCLSRCKFCSFYHSKTNKNQIDGYVDDLMKELEMVSKSEYAKSAPFNAIYFGGGTPTDLSAQTLERILSHLNNNWNIANDCETTIEGRLYQFTDDKIETCLNNGVNRFSFGVQSFNTKIRRQMGRIMSREKVLAKLADISVYNQANISVDLIYGFPDQTNEIWQNDIETVAECADIDSASIYRLKFLPDSPIMDQIKEGKLSPTASPEQQIEQFNMSNEYFRTIGARRAGVTHWAFSNRERTVYNTIPKYQHSCLPIGCGAGGSMGKYRTFQRMELADYSAKVANNEKPIAMGMEIERGTRFEGKIAGSLEETLSLNLTNLAKISNNPNLIEISYPLLEQWEKAGMITFNKEFGIIKLTDAGVYHCVSLAQNLIDFYKWKGIK